MAGRWVAVAVSLAAIAACTKFGTDENAPSDAGSEAAPDATPVTPGPCTPLPPSSDPGAACVDCVPVALYDKGRTVFSAVIVSDQSLYAMSAGTLFATTQLDTVPPAKLEPGITTADTTIEAMGLDAKNVYVTTNRTVYQGARGGGTAASEVLPVPFAPPAANPLYFGRTLLFQLQPMKILSAPLGASGDGGSSVSVSTTAGLAIDGDTAYWLGQNAIGEEIVLGPFPSLDQQASVAANVLGFAVKGDLAFVAEPAKTNPKAGVISRVSLGAGGRGMRFPLANEPGVIESVHASGNRVYWVSRRPPLGDRVFVSVDACGGVPTVHATGFDRLARNLSFAGDFAFFVPKDGGAIYRMKK